MAMKTICKHGKVIPMGTKCKCKIRTAPSIKRELSESDKLMKSYRWKKLRLKIINRDCFCQRCFYKYNIINSSINELTVHHILSRHTHIELMFDEDNLMCLCDTCNKQLGTKNKLDFEWKVPEKHTPVL